MRVLLAEDDSALAYSLIRGLRERAYLVDPAADGATAVYKAGISDYDAVILDVNLPNKNGFEVCRELRRHSANLRILMLTARGELKDRIEGLDSGADDYLVKPFEFEELLARLRALLRRKGDQLEPATLTVCDLEIDLHAQRVMRAGMPLELTTKEYVMLAYLARNAGRVVGRAEISEHVWDENHDPSSNLIEVYVNRLRRKVDRPGMPPLIHTRRGAGYFFGGAPAWPSGSR